MLVFLGVFVRPHVAVSFALLLAAAAAAAPPPVRLAFESPLSKVFLDAPAPPGVPVWTASMARGERESFQLLITASTANLSGVTVRLDPPPDGFECEVTLVGHVRTSASDPRPWSKTEAVGRIGWWPDPLLPNRPFSLARGETQSVWVTLYARPRTRPGEYQGALRVEGGAHGLAHFRVRVYDVELPQVQQLRNAAFMPPGNLSAHYRPEGGITGAAFWELYQRWVRKAFSQHLGPTFDMMQGWNQGQVRTPQTAGPLGPTAEMLLERPEKHLVWPVLGGRGDYDFHLTDQLAKIGDEYGMRQFSIAIFDNKEAWDQHSPKMKEDMADFLRAYVAHLRKAGRLADAYVYNVDEPPESQWDTVRNNHTFVKSVVPDLKTWLCLNQPKAMLGLRDFTDILDVYIRQYDADAVETYRKADKQIIWAVCVWPHEHPNLFIEYPAADARMIGWLTYQYRISGFEYWGLNQWGPNTGKLDWANFRGGSTRTAWRRPHFPWGDGWLLYPGPEGEPLSSLRFENVRDGFEDAELLLLLEKSGAASRARELAASVARSTTSYVTDPARIEAAHVELLKALAASRGSAQGR